MASTLSLSLLLAIMLVPLATATVVGIFGTAAAGRVLSYKAGHTITIAGVAVSFILSVWVLVQVIHGARFNQTVYEWMRVGNLRMEIGFLIDGMTALMMCVVTFVSLMVHVYSTGYMRGDAGYNRFFAYISLFTFAMLLLVMSNNLLQLFIGWEGVGVASYLLIGFWFDQPGAILANKKAFLINRVADLGFILGIGLIVAQTGSLNYTEIFSRLDVLNAAVLPGIGWSVLTVAAICLFIGAMGKSAQFPLHVWLPDSMHGPTPSSALIHAATMVTAGIFMVSRMSALFELSDLALNVILTVGAVTAFLMGLMGLIQYDIKRVVAYSTLSQLGYMVMGLGVSAYQISLFHLFTHAFFKALLFLAAGSVIMGMHHNQDMRYMGGLRKYMPLTHWTSLAGTLALIGMPFFSGFYSKDGIILALGTSNQTMAPLAFWAALLSVITTAFYSMRMYFLVFWGRERYHENPDAHHHAGHYQHHESAKPHESPWTVTVPLILLAIPSVFIGFFTLRPLVFSSFLADAISINEAQHPTMHYLTSNFHSAWSMTLHGFIAPPCWFMAIGAIAAGVLYLGNNKLASYLRQIFAPVVRILENKYYIDRFYEKVAQGACSLGQVLWLRIDNAWMWFLDQGISRALCYTGQALEITVERLFIWIVDDVLTRLARFFGTLLWKGGDEGVIEARFVNASWMAVGAMAARLRRIQTGYLYHYALCMVLGLLALLTWVVWII